MSDSAKSAKIYQCEICNINCSKKNDYDRHILTSKHKSKRDGNKESATLIFVCGNCNNEYKSRKGLWGHKKTCNINHQITSNNNIAFEIVDKQKTNNDVIQVLIKENSDFKTMLMDMLKRNTDLVQSHTDLMQSNAELQKQVLEVCKNVQGTNNINNMNNNNNVTHTNSHNKSFNLQFFLNETCKDAMNMSDFIDSMKRNL